MSNKEKVENLKKLGNEALNNERFDEASKYYSEAIALDRENHVLWSNRSAVYAKKKDFSRALEDANKTIELNPKWARGYSRKGAALHGLCEYDESISAYREGLKIEPDNESIKQAIKSVENDKSSQGNQVNNLLLQLNKVFSPEVWNTLKNLPKFSQFANDPSFIKILEEIQFDPSKLSNYISDQRITQYMIAAMGSMQNGGASAPDFGDDLNMDWEPEKSYSNGNANANGSNVNNVFSNSNKSESKKTCEQKKPELSENEKKTLELKEKGNTSYGLRNFDEAIDFYKQALAIDSDNFSIKLNITAVMVEQGRYEEAIEECQKIIDEAREKRADFATIGKAYARIGNVYSKKEDYDKAIENYKKSLTEKRDASVLKSLREVESKKEKAEKLAYINPELSLVAKEEGNSFFKAGKFPEAVKSYTEAIKRDPTNTVLYTNRANTYIKLGALPSAIEDCNEALKIDQKFLKAYLRKGNAQLLMKDYTEAIKTLDEGLKLDPNNQELTDLLNKAVYALNGYSNEADDPNETPEKILEKAMRVPEVRKILEDPIMQQMLQQMTTDPAAAREYLKDPEIARRIAVLRAHKVIR